MQLDILQTHVDVIKWESNDKWSLNEGTSEADGVWTVIEFGPTPILTHPELNEQIPLNQWFEVALNFENLKIMDRS